MLKNSLLIRRPLIQSGNSYAVGFDIDRIQVWFGLTPLQSSEQGACDRGKQLDLETCPDPLQ
jgi:hypothetical protein